MTSKRAVELWNSGIPISAAWREFALSALKAKFEQVPSFAESLEQDFQLESRPHFILSFAKAGKCIVARKNLEQAMKEELLSVLFNGDLLATGYRESPSKSQSPVIIDPTKFYSDDPDWADETLDVEGIRYGRIRISPRQTMNEHLDDSRGSKSIIDQTIESLQKSDPDFCKLPRKTACAKIRAQLGEHISGNGLSLKNLEKAILRNCGSKRIRANSN